MPSTSKKQHKFMEAIAHSPSFAKKVGVPQSVGKDFSSADKGRKFSKGGDMKKFNMDRYADGGMPMVNKGGKMVPSFAADGKGKMAAGGPARPNPNPKPDKAKPVTTPVRPDLKPPTRPTPGTKPMPPKPSIPVRPAPQPSPGMPARPGPKPPTKPMPGTKPVISDVYPTLPKPTPYMPGRPGAKPSPGMPARPGPKPLPTKPMPEPVISDIYTTLPKPMPKPMPQIMGGSADKMGPRPGFGNMSTKMAKGGMAHKDVKMDKGMMQKAVNKHEGRLHKGESMTKLASGGTAKKMNMGGMAYAKGGFTKAADGIATKGKTKGMMVKMARGGKAC